MIENPSDWISLSAATIALCALFVTVWQSHLSRKHNMLSVAPQLSTRLTTKDSCRWVLENNGLGPALLLDFEVSIGAKKITNPYSDPYPEILKQAGVSGARYDYHLPVKDHSIAANSSMELLKVTAKKIEDTDSISAALEDTLHFTVKYCGMYRNGTSTATSDVVKT